MDYDVANVAMQRPVALAQTSDQLSLSLCSVGVLAAAAAVVPLRFG